MAADRGPVAQTIAERIRARILAGEWGPGEMIPTYRELSEQYGGSTSTIVRAVGILIADGLVISDPDSPRRGTRIRETELRYPILSIDAGRTKAVSDVWNAWVESEGRQPGNRLVVTVEPPPRPVATALKQPPGEPCTARRRTRLVDGEPWMISTGWWPQWLAAGSPLEINEDMQNPSPLRWAAEHGHGQVHTENEIGARMPTPAEADELHTGRGIPVMTMLTTGWDADGRPIRCTADVFPAHRFRLVVSNERREP